jgi:hypothetical protein
MSDGPHAKLTPRQVAERIGRGLNFVMRLIRSRELAHERHPPATRGGRPRYFVRPADVDAWEGRHRVPAQGPAAGKGRDRRHRTKGETPVLEIIR